MWFKGALIAKVVDTVRHRALASTYVARLILRANVKKKKDFKPLIQTIMVL